MGIQATQCCGEAKVRGLRHTTKVLVSIWLVLICEMQSDNSMKAKKCKRLTVTLWVLTFLMVLDATYAVGHAAWDDAGNEDAGGAVELNKSTGTDQVNAKALVLSNQLNLHITMG